MLPNSYFLVGFCRSKTTFLWNFPTRISDLLQKKAPDPVDVQRTFMGNLPVLSRFSEKTDKEIGLRNRYWNHKSQPAIFVIQISLKPSRMPAAHPDGCSRPWLHRLICYWVFRQVAITGDCYSLASLDAKGNFPVFPLLQIEQRTLFSLFPECFLIVLILEMI